MQIFDTIKKLLNLLVILGSGSNGFDRVTGTTNNDKQYYAIRPVGGSATLGASTTVIDGDSPQGDSFGQDTILFGAFDDIEVTSGTVYAYYR